MFTSLLFVFCLTCPQEDAGPHPDEDRYLSALMRSPRPGVAFDRWYQSALENGRLESVLRERSEAAETTSSVPEIVVLGLLFERMGRSDEALSTLERAETLSPDDHLPSLLRGNLLQRRRSYRDALAAFERSLAKDPPAAERSNLMLEIGRLRLQLGLTGEAFQTFRQLVDENPEDRYLREELAELLGEQGQHDEALNHWDTLVEQHPEDVFLHYRGTLAIARIHEQRDRAGEALQAYERLLDHLDPASWQATEVHHRIAEALREDPAEYGRFLQQRTEDRPDNLGDRLRWIEHLLAVGEPERALAQLDEAQLRSPHSDAPFDVRIRVHETQRDFDAALSAARSWIAARPDHTAPYLRTVELLRRQLLETEEEASLTELASSILHTLDDLGATAADDAALAHEIADVIRDVHLRLRLSGDPTTTGPVHALLADAAERWYSAATDRDPVSAAYWEAKGDWQLELERPEDAVQSWWSMVEAPRDAEENWHRLIDLLSKHQRMDEALKAAREQFARGHRSVACYERLVEVLIRHAETSGIREEFDQAMSQLLELDPSPSQLAASIERRIDFELTAGTLDTAIDRYPADEDDVGRCWLRGRLLFATARREEARASFERAWSLLPESEPLAREVASTLESLDFIDEAVAVLEASAERFPSSAPQFLERSVRLLRMANRVPDALVAARRLYDLRSDLLATHRLLAEMEFLAGDAARGIEVLRGAVRVAPRDVQIRLALAEKLWEADALLDAFEHEWRCFEICHSLDERRGLAVRLATHAIRLGRADDLLERVEALGRPDPNKEHLLCLYDVQRHVHRVTEAHETLQRLQDRYPADPEVLLERKRVALDDGDIDTAVGSLERLVAIRPEVDLLEELAILYTVQTRRDDAARTWKRLARTTDDLRPLIAQVEVAVQAGDAEQALDLAEIGLAIEPDSWRLLTVAGWLHAAADRTDVADRMFTTLLQRTTSQPKLDLRATIPRLMPDHVSLRIPLCDPPGIDDRTLLPWSRRSPPATSPNAHRNPYRWPSIPEFATLEHLARIDREWNGREPVLRARGVFTGTPSTLEEARLLALLASARLCSENDDDRNAWFDAASSRLASDHDRAELAAVAWFVGLGDRAHHLASEMTNAPTWVAALLAAELADPDSTRTVDGSVLRVLSDGLESWRQHRPASMAHLLERLTAVLIEREEIEAAGQLLRRFGFVTRELAGLIRLAPRFAACEDPDLVSAWIDHRERIAPTAELSIDDARAVLWARGHLDRPGSPRPSPLLFERAVGDVQSPSISRMLVATTKRWILQPDGTHRFVEAGSPPPSDALPLEWIDLAHGWIDRSDRAFLETLLADAQQHIEVDRPDHWGAREAWYQALLWWSDRSDVALGRLEALQGQFEGDDAWNLLAVRAFAHHSAGEVGAALRLLDEAEKTHGKPLPAALKISITQRTVIGTPDQILEGLLYRLQLEKLPELRRELPKRDAFQRAYRLAHPTATADRVQQRRADGKRALMDELPPAIGVALPDLLTHAKETGQLDVLRAAVTRHRRDEPEDASLLALDALAALIAGEGALGAELLESWREHAFLGGADPAVMISEWLAIQAMRDPASRESGAELRNDLWARSFHDGDDRLANRLFAASLRTALRHRGPQGASDETNALLESHDQFLSTSALRHDEQRQTEARQQLLGRFFDSIPASMQPVVAESWLQAIQATLRIRYDGTLVHEFVPATIGPVLEQAPQNRHIKIAKLLEALLFSYGPSDLPRWHGPAPTSDTADVPLVSVLLKAARRAGTLDPLRRRWDAHPQADRPAMKWLRQRAHE